MPRDIPVGNGRLLVCFDKNYQIRDLYFPHVGQENHVSGNAFRLGVLAGNRFSWVGEDWRKAKIYRQAASEIRDAASRRVKYEWRP